MVMSETLQQANGSPRRRVGHSRKRGTTTDPRPELQLALFEDAPAGSAVNEVHDPQGCTPSPDPAERGVIPSSEAHEADAGPRALELVEDEAGGPDTPRDPDPLDMRELLGTEEFAEISRLVGNSLGRAVWRQVREAQGEQQNAQNTPLS